MTARLNNLWFAALALFIAAVPAHVHATPIAPDTDPPTEKNIVEVAGEGGFETLVAAVKAAGLAETLASEGPFTVFAPTDEAFAQLPEGTLEALLKPENSKQLVDILTYHVVPGRVTAKEVTGLESAKTLQGDMLDIATSDGHVQINGATVTTADVEASNGVVHVIDQVLLPPSEEM